jgi:hypothetical protein
LTVIGPSTNGCRWRIDAFDLAVLVTFLGLSMWTAAVLVAQQTPQQIWTGTNGPYIGDQMQYLGWIRDSAKHVFIDNPFDTKEGSYDYLNPGLAISGLLVRLGAAAWISYLMWTPLAAVGLFVATRAYVRRLVTGTAKRRSALILALFYISPVAELARLLHWNQLIFVGSLSLEMWPGLYLWGYPLTAITVALMIGTLIAYERDRRDGRVRLWAPICALFCSWLQPWQGATVILIVLVTEALLWWRGHPTPLALPAATAASATLPLGSYYLLSHVDAAWALSGRVNFSQGIPVGDLLITVSPLFVCAILAYRTVPMTFQGLAVRIWPFAAFAVLRFIQLAHVGTFPTHALQGLSIPLGVLAVIGASRLRLGLPALTRVILGTVLVAGLIGPSLVRELDDAHGFATPTIFGYTPYFIRPSERDALNYLNRSPEPGAVLSTLYLGQIVPAETGRETWVGIVSWTPNYVQRVALADALFSGKLGSAQAAAAIKSSRVRFLLSDCRRNFDLKRLVPTILATTKRFGCATVYRVATVHGRGRK